MSARSLGLGLVLAIAGCTSAPTPLPPTPVRAALGPVAVVGVGNIPQGAESTKVFAMTFTEIENDSITSGQGSFQVTLTDSAGLADTVSWTGTPALDAPGSLGATARLIRPNILTVTIVDSDVVNIEAITIMGLGIAASSSAALGPINAVVNGCAGSLVGCTVANVLASPGSVVAP